MSQPGSLVWVLILALLTRLSGQQQALYVTTTTFANADCTGPALSSSTLYPGICSSVPGSTTPTYQTRTWGLNAAETLATLTTRTFTDPTCSMTAGPATTYTDIGLVHGTKCKMNGESVSYSAALPKFPLTGVQFHGYTSSSSCSSKAVATYKNATTAGQCVSWTGSRGGVTGDNNLYAILSCTRASMTVNLYTNVRCLQSSFVKSYTKTLAVAPQCSVPNTDEAADGADFAFAECVGQQILDPVPMTSPVAQEGSSGGYFVRAFYSSSRCGQASSPSSSSSSSSSSVSVDKDSLPLYYSVESFSTDKCLAPGPMNMYGAPVRLSCRVGKNKVTLVREKYRPTDATCALPPDSETIHAHDVNCVKDSLTKLFEKTVCGALPPGLASAEQVLFKSFDDPSCSNNGETRSVIMNKCALAPGADPYRFKLSYAGTSGSSLLVQETRYHKEDTGCQGQVVESSVLKVVDGVCQRDPTRPTGFVNRVSWLGSSSSAAALPAWFAAPLSVTAPTVPPTAAPSAPSPRPTRATSRPTRPTARPTVRPTPKPTTATPSALPSAQPTQAPTYTTVIGEGHALCDLWSQQSATVKSTTNFTNWCGATNSTGVYTNAPCSTTNAWAGVTCSSFGGVGRVVKIVLSLASLTGTMPPSLGSLLQLTYLDLSSNSLAGSIPATLAALTNLQYLALSSNSLVGSLPASVASSLSALTYLGLYSNSLVGPIPATMGFISRVKSLLLSSNKMTGAVPESICGVNASIASITLDGNYFSGCYPACLNVIKSFVPPTGSGVGPCFSATDGDANALCDLYAKFSATANLGTKLTNWGCTSANKGPYGNFISGPCSTSKAWFGVTCSAVNGALRVTKLDVKGNNNNLTANSAPIPASIGNMDAMTWLDISSCSFGGKIPVTLGSMSDLNHLEIQSNKLTGTLPMALSRLSDMTYFSFDTNRLVGPLPAQVLAAMPGLKKLAADNNRFTGTIPAVLGQLVQLNYLKVSNNLLVGSIPFQLCNLPKGIGTLNFTSNPSLTCYAPCLSVSSGYTALRVDTARTPCYSLSVSDGVALCNLLTKVTDTSSPAKLSSWTAGCATKNAAGTFLAGPCSTGAFAWTGVGCTTTDSVSRVSSLVLRNMSVTFKASLPSLIGSLTALTRLDLFSSSFESSLPTELGMLTNLVSLQLGGNKFTKSVPSQLASLKSLTLLGLASNSLTGRLPAGLWWLTKLNQLSLDRNRFSGPISPNIGQLTGLQGLSLGANSFAGVVPGQVCNLNQTVASHLDVSGNSGLTCMPACITGGGVSSSILSMRNYFSDGSWDSAAFVTEVNLYVFSLAFTTSVDIYITAVQFYKISGHASAYSAGAPIQAAIYVTTGQAASAVYTGTKVGGTVTFTSQSASGWQTQALPKPVKVAAGSGVVIAMNYPFDWSQSANSGVFKQTAVGPFTDIHSQYNPDQASPKGYPILPTTRQTTNRLIDIQFSLYADLLPSCMPYKYPYPSTTNLAYLTGVALSGSNIPLGTIASLLAQYTVTFDYMPQTAYTNGDNRNILTLAVAGSIYGMAGSAIPRVMYSPKGYFLSQTMTSAMAPWIDVVSSGGSRGNTPISLIGSTNLALWLDASDTAAFTFSGTTVTQWQSSSTPMVTFMPDTGSGNAGWSATGLGGVAPGVQMMNKGFKSTTNPALPPTGDYTVVYVGTIGSTASAWGALFDHGSRDNDVVWERNEATGNVHFQSNNDNTGCNLAYTADSPMILIGTNTGGVKRDVYSIDSAFARTNASCTNTYSMKTGTAAMCIGESDNTDGEYGSGVVSEIIYYQRVLSASEISTIQTYLINKWFSWTNHAWLSPTQPMPVNLWTSFSITMDFQKAVFSFAATNGTNIARQLSAMPTPAQTTWSNVNVYACFVGADSSTATSFSCGQGLIRNIYITSGISVALPTVLPLFMFPGPANGFLAAQNQILGVVNLPAQYALNFDFFPTTDSDSGFRMMLCLTVAPLSLRGVPSGESFNGARLPCVGFANAAAYGTYYTLGSKKTGFSANTPVLTVLTTSVSDAWDPSLPLPGALPKNAWTSFVVKVDFLNLVKSMATTGGVINAVASAPMEIPPQTTWRGVYIMAPNGLATAASGYLRNVAVAPITVKVPIVQPLLSLPGSAYSVANAGWPKITLSQQIGTVSLPQQFTVTLDVYLNQQASAASPFFNCAFALYDGPFSASVRLLGLYFVASTGASHAGQVLPSDYFNIVFPDESRSATAYSRIATMQDAPSKQWTSYSITKDFVNSAWSVATSGGVAIPRTVIRALPYQSALSGVTVWATQPGSAPVADGYVRNIVISSGVAAAVPPLPAVLPLLSFPGPSTGLSVKAGCSFGQMSLPAQYTVSFDFMPTAHNGNVKTSFFLLSVVGTLGVAGNVGGLTGNVGNASTAGGRMLAYYLTPNSTAVGGVPAGTFPSLSPLFETNIATTECFSYSTTPLALNAWSTFTATMDVTNSVVTSTVSGATTIGPASLLFPAQTTTTFAGQAVSADPTTGVTAATGWLRNVLIVATPIATPVYPGAGPSGTSQLFKQTFSSIGSLLASNTVMGTITSLPAQYTLTFDFLPLSDGTGWRNIITMAQQGVTAGSAGFRLPAVHLSAGCDWVLNNVPQCQYPTLSAALSIAASGSNSVGLIGLANKARLPLSQFATFSIYVDLTNAMVSWTVSVAGAVLIKQVSAPLQKPVPTTFSNVDVQACGSSLCASGYVRNLVVRRGVPMLSMTDDGDFQVQGWNPTAAPTPVPPALPNLPFSLLSSQGGNMSVSFLDHHNNVIPSTQGATSVVVSFTLANPSQSSSALFNIAVASAATANVLAVGGGGMAAAGWGGGGGGGAVYTAPLTMRPGYNFMINVGAGGGLPRSNFGSLITDGSFSNPAASYFLGPNYVFSLAFTTSSDVVIYAIRFYKFAGKSSFYNFVRKAAIYVCSTRASNGAYSGPTQVGSNITFTGETDSGWQTQALPSRVRIPAGSKVVIAMNFAFDSCMTPCTMTQTTAGPFSDIHSQYGDYNTTVTFPTYVQMNNRMIDFSYSLSLGVGGTTSIVGPGTNITAYGGGSGQDYYLPDSTTAAPLTAGFLYSSYYISGQYGSSGGGWGGTGSSPNGPFTATSAGPICSKKGYYCKAGGNGVNQTDSFSEFSGGGGGAGTTGLTALGSATTGAGGAGRTWKWTGPNVFYGAGGGGASAENPRWPFGGPGGNGVGGDGASSYGRYSGGNGRPHTGSGGGSNLQALTSGSVPELPLASGSGGMGGSGAVRMQFPIVQRQFAQTFSAVNVTIFGRGGGGGASLGDAEGGQGGAFTAGMVLPLGSSFHVVVGSGGQYRPELTDPGFVGGDGWGGAAAPWGYGAQGGGLTGIFSGSGAISQATAVLIAGGGGGGGWHSGCPGGGGGGTSGSAANCGGRGASQTSPGVMYDTWENSDGWLTNGSPLQGGSWAQRNTGHSCNFGGGGGGGGGYFGGGSGGNCAEYAGGGGSGFYTTSPWITWTSTPQLCTGANYGWSTSALSCATSKIPWPSQQMLSPFPFGQGGTGSKTNGISGAVIIQYPLSYPPLITAGAVIVTTDGQNRVYKFTSSGSFTYAPDPIPASPDIPQTFPLSLSLWGGGGGGWRGDSNVGGTGGVARGVLIAGRGQAFNVVVGGGGVSRAALTDPGPWVSGFGGLAAFYGYSAQGGGLSGIFSGSGAISQATAVLIAGGGGGSGFGGGGGAGGGAVGDNGKGPNSGTGATQTSGGSGGYNQGGVTDGQALQGGSYGQVRDNGDYSGGGGGGGGYWGGGAGYTGDSPEGNSGGGGGSSYASPVLQTSELFSGSSTKRLSLVDPQGNSWGLGGLGAPSANFGYQGGAGAVVVQYPVSFPPFRATTGAVTVVQINGMWVYTWTSNGSFTI